MIWIGGKPFRNSSGAKPGDMKGSFVVSGSLKVSRISLVSLSISSSLNISSFEGIWRPKRSCACPTLEGKKGACM